MTYEYSGCYNLRKNYGRKLIMDLYSKLLHEGEQVDYIFQIVSNRNKLYRSFIPLIPHLSKIIYCNISAVYNEEEISLLTISNSIISKSKLIKILRYAVDIKDLTEIKVIITFYNKKNTQQKCFYFFKMN